MTSYQYLHGAVQATTDLMDMLTNLTFLLLKYNGVINKTLSMCIDACVCVCYCCFLLASLIGNTYLCGTSNGGE